jgi:hypothetical protein
MLFASRLRAVSSSRSIGNRSTAMIGPVSISSSTWCALPPFGHIVEDGAVVAANPLVIGQASGVKIYDAQQRPVEKRVTQFARLKDRNSKIEA